MAVIAPWLQPTNVLDAMRSGASLGLQLRGQNIAMAEAAARREQEAEELEARQQTAADALRVQRESGAARLALAASNAAAQVGARKEATAARNAALTLQTRAQNRLEQAQAFDEEQAKKKAEQQPLDLIYDEKTKRWYQRRGTTLYPVTSAPTAGATPLQKAEETMQRKAYNEAADKLRAQSARPTPNPALVKQATKDFQSASNALFRLSPQQLPPTLSTKDLPSAAAEKIRQDYRAGKIPKAEAVRMLRELGFE